MLVNNVGTNYGRLLFQGKNNLQKAFDVMTVDMFSCVGVSYGTCE